MNITSFANQSNTQAGPRPYLAGADLTGMEGRLAVMTSTGLQLPSASTDRAIYLILEGAASGGEATAVALDSSRNFRVYADGTGDKGVELSISVESGKAGMVRDFDALESGSQRIVAIAEEDFVDGQLVLLRPYAFGVETAS